MMRVAGAVAMSAVLALGAAACGDDGGGSGDGNSVTIGFMGDLTGENSGLVIPPKQGAELAIEQYNATNPEVKIELKTYDSQGKPDQATTLATGAVKSDGIVAMIGPAFSGESQSVGPILEEAGVPSISPSATGITLAEQGWKYWHRVVADDTVQSAGVATFITGSLKAEKVFLTHDNQEYGKGLADAIAKGLGDQVEVQTDPVDAQATDYSSTVNKIVEFAPEVVYFGGYYADAGNLFKQLREGGYEGKLMSGDGSFAPQLIEAVGQQDAQGALISCGCLVDTEGTTNETAKRFAADYQAKFGSPPAVYSSEGYDAATAFIKAVQEGNTEPDKINEFLKGVNFEGVGKSISFAENGELAAKDIFIYEVQGTEMPLLGTAEEAQAS